MGRVFFILDTYFKLLVAACQCAGSGMIVLLLLSSAGKAPCLGATTGRRCMACPGGTVPSRTVPSRTVQGTLAVAKGCVGEGTVVLPVFAFSRALLFQQLDSGGAFW